MSTTRPLTIALFCVPMWGHVQRVLPLIAGLARRGCAVHTFTHSDFRDDVERAGGRFVDLDGRYPMAAVDTETYPLGCRQLSYAAAYALPLREELRTLAPSLVVHDAFAVVGAVLGHLMGLPTVTVPAGHNRNVRAIPEVVQNAPRVEIGPACRAAVETVASWGLPDVSPYFYLSWRSRQLNVYCEPPAFLLPDEREPFEPIVFFGSLWPERHARPVLPGPAWPGRGSSPANARRRVYISFGTMAWRYYPQEMLAALGHLTGALAERGADVIVSLGGWEGVRAEASRLARDHVRVEPWLDQWAVLREADLFITHHGLNSTHEALWHRVPMLSLPLFADQPYLARRCQDLGLAVPLVRGQRFPEGPRDIHDALGELADQQAQVRERLAIARGWEEDVIAQREQVLDRIVALARGAR